MTDCLITVSPRLAFDSSTENLTTPVPLPAFEPWLRTGQVVTSRAGQLSFSNGAEATTSVTVDTQSTTTNVASVLFMPRLFQLSSGGSATTATVRMTWTSGTNTCNTFVVRRIAPTEAGVTDTALPRTLVPYVDAGSTITLTTSTATLSGTLLLH